MVAYNNNVNAGFAGYDNTNNDRIFLEDIKNLPSGINSGRFYIGLKSNGSSLQANDTISIGDLTSTGALATQARFADDLTDLQGLGWTEKLIIQQLLFIQIILKILNFLTIKLIIQVHF